MENQIKCKDFHITFPHYWQLVSKVLPSMISEHALQFTEVTD